MSTHKYYYCIQRYSGYLDFVKAVIRLSYEWIGCFSTHRMPFCLETVGKLSLSSVGYSTNIFRIKLTKCYYFKENTSKYLLILNLNFQMKSKNLPPWTFQYSKTFLKTGDVARRKDTCHMCIRSCFDSLAPQWTLFKNKKAVLG